MAGRKTSTAAAIPLVIALAGATTLPSSKSGLETRSRIAPTATALDIRKVPLDSVQQGWLQEHNPHGVPKSDHAGNWTVVVREGYTLQHNNVDLIADWVSYHLTKKYVNGAEKRPGTAAFRPEQLLPKGSRAELDDYAGWQGVYDRGHQCASGDSKGRGASVIRDSFFLSNMTPQSSQLNQLKWRLLEERIQKLADERGDLWVVTGPAFVDVDGDGVANYFVLGKNRVAVPTHYFKIVLAKTSVGFEAMAFLIPNEATKPDFEYDDHLVSIDRIERLTGFDFFSELDDADEKKLEKSAAVSTWELKK